MSLRDHTQAGWRRYFSSLSTGTLIARRISRTRHLALEFLESRQLLSTTVTEYPTPTSRPGSAYRYRLPGRQALVHRWRAMRSACSTRPVRARSRRTRRVCPWVQGPSRSQSDRMASSGSPSSWGGRSGRSTRRTRATAFRITALLSGMPANARPFGITTGPDGQGHQVIWFTDVSNNALGEINPSSPGTVTEFSVPNTLTGFSLFNSVITAGRAESFTSPNMAAAVPGSGSTTPPPRPGRKSPFPVARTRCLLA